MYGVIDFSRGQKAGLTEFRAETKKYGRGSACRECRLSRAKCTGKFDGSYCKRCKRRAIPCHYSNSLIQRQHRNSSTSDDSGMSTTPTRLGSPDMSNLTSHSSSAPSSPQADIAEENETSRQLEKSNGLNFDSWPPLHALQQPSSPKITSAAGSTPPMIQSLQAFFPEQFHEDTYTWGLSGANSQIDMAGQDLTTLELFLDGRDCPLDAFGPLCNCYQSMTSSLSILWSWSLDGQPEARLGISADVTIDRAKVEDFLALFKTSFAQLEIVEICPGGCIWSQDLAILVLLVIKQLSKLLKNLSADFTKESGGLPLGLSLKSLEGPQATTNNNIQQGQGIQLVRIGSFEIKDTTEMLVIIKMLLQIRAKTLDTYICRWTEGIRQYGLKKLDAELQRIREDLSNMA